MSDTPLIRSLRAAVEATPDDVPMRLHLAGLLLDAGERDEAISHIAAALQHEPDSDEGRALMARAVGAAEPAAEPVEPVEPATPPSHDPSPGDDERPPIEAEAHEYRIDPDVASFDWQAAEQEFSHVEPPVFLEGGDPSAERAYDVEQADVRLTDVGGMEQVKERLEAAFLAPMRNPDLRRLYGKRLRGGLLLYGPPGCGKTFIARAVAGELGARFLAVSLADVLDMYIGQSERNLREVFQAVRRSAPCVLFLDEVDAIGQKRSHLRHSAMRGTVNQLLAELDDVGQSNEGVFVLAATNHPWDVDTALRRPGRLDRTLLVLPPDLPAREAILRYHLRDRPVANLDLRRVAQRTDGYSGADLAHVCETAAERAMLDSVRRGEARMIEARDIEAALAEVKSSTGPWFDTARNVALFANEGGAYDDLLDYLRRRRMA